MQLEDVEVKAVKVVLIVLILFTAFIVVVIFSQPLLMSLDGRARNAFIQKAERLSIIGRSQDYIRDNFGAPQRIYYVDGDIDGDEMWVYLPGPTLTWPSACEIRFNTQKVVEVWGID
jgi:hypothetical protein